jgi:hypothetical protein
MLVGPDEDVAVCRHYMLRPSPTCTAVTYWLLGALWDTLSGYDVAGMLGGRDASRVVNQIKSRAPLKGGEGNQTHMVNK